MPDIQGTDAADILMGWDPGEVRRVSVDSSGAQIDAGAAEVAISPDAGQIAFVSGQAGLAPGAAGGFLNVYVENLYSGGVSLASSSSSGVGADADVLNPVFGGYGLGFMTAADNLVAGDTNGVEDLFIKNTQDGSIARVSTDSSGGQANGPSMDLAFANGDSRIGFTSWASNLVANDTNGVGDVFGKDLITGAVTLISSDSSGVEGNGQSNHVAFSLDGTKAVFESAASNLVAGDTNGSASVYTPDIFLKNLVTGQTTRVSTDSSGHEANAGSFAPVISADGTKVVFSSDASNLAPGDTNGVSDIFIKDLVTGVTTRISTDASGGQANGPSGHPVLSFDGTEVAFHSDASNLAPGDTNGASDVFVKNMTTGAVTLLSSDGHGAPGNGDSGDPAMPFYFDVLLAQYSLVAFPSNASNLVPGDSNGASDVFVKATVGADDFIEGYGGDDVLTGKAGNDVLDGGDGIDTAVFSGSRADYALDVDGSSGGYMTVRDLRPGSPDGLDQLFNIERLAFADTTLDLTSPIDLSGSSDSYTVTLYSDIGQVVVDDLTTGTSTDHTIIGPIDVRTGSGDDTFVIVGTQVPFHIDGGGGQNKIVAHYDGVGSPITLAMDTAPGATSHLDIAWYGIQNTFTNIQMADVSASADQSTLQGGDGPDTLDLGSGLSTSVAGGGGDDTVTGSERLFGDAGDDLVIAQHGHYRYASAYLQGGTGDDTLAGNGFNYVPGGIAGPASYAVYADVAGHVGAIGGVTVDLDSTGPQDTGGAGVDTLTNVEGAIGTRWNDSLSGGYELDGAGGDDQIAHTVVADYHGPRASYDITASNGVVTVKDLRPGSPDGTDTVVDVQFLSFSDQGVALWGLSANPYGPDNMLLEAGDGVAGQPDAMVDFFPANSFGPVSYVTAGWTPLGGSLWERTGTYGSAVLDTVAGTLSYHLDDAAPATNALVAGQDVFDDFVVTIANALTSVDTPVTFEVQGANDAPVAGADALQTTAGAAVSVSAAQLLLNDSDPEGDAFSITAVGQAQHGVVALANGQVTFMPDAGFTGQAAFDYTVTDANGASTTGQVAVAVAAAVPSLPAYIYHGGRTAPESVDLGADGFGHQFLAGAGDTVVFTGAAGSSVRLGSGAGIVHGGTGKDVITFGPGLGTVTGGAGPDDFIFVKGQIADPAAHGGQYDTVTDFAGAGAAYVAGRDFIHLKGFASSATITYEHDLASDPTAHLYRVDDGAYHSEFVLAYAGAGLNLSPSQYGFL